MEKERCSKKELSLFIWSYTRSNTLFTKNKNTCHDCFSSIFVPVEKFDIAWKLVWFYCKSQELFFFWTGEVILIFLHQKDYFKRFQNTIKNQIKFLFYFWHLLNFYLTSSFLNLVWLLDEQWGLKKKKIPVIDSREQCKGNITWGLDEERSNGLKGKY